ncbi:MAG: FesM, partial [Chloroflexota bacterium]
IPLAVGIWLAHYGFHFSTGALAIVPVFQSFLLDHGITLLGTEPNWALGPLFPGSWLLPMQTIIVFAGFIGTLYTANRIARDHYSDPGVSVRALMPWILVFLALAIASLWTFNLPMEMRGTVFLGG